MSWGSTSSRQGGALPRDWAATRRRVLSRDAGTCVMCGSPATDVDHVGDPRDHSLSNLRALCRRCHMRRTASQAHASRRSRGWTRGTRRQFRPGRPHPGDRSTDDGDQGADPEEV